MKERLLLLSKIHFSKKKIKYSKVMKKEVSKILSFLSIILIKVFSNSLIHILFIKYAWTISYLIQMRDCFGQIFQNAN